MIFRSENGQSFIELIVALGIGVAMISVAASGMFLVLRSGQLAQQSDASSNFASSLINDANSFSQANWHNIYDLGKGSLNHYYFSTSTGQLAIQSGDENLTVNGISFAVKFSLSLASKVAKIRCSSSALKFGGARTGSNLAVFKNRPLFSK